MAKVKPKAEESKTLGEKFSEVVDNILHPHAETPATTGEVSVDPTAPDADSFEPSEGFLPAGQTHIKYDKFKTLGVTENDK